jgi:hypothetical protein
MLVKCPHCGGKVVVNGFGRRPLNIPVIKVYDALQRHRSVTAAAEELGCSRGYIYKILKTGWQDSGCQRRRQSSPADRAEGGQIIARNLIFPQPVMD